MSTTPRNPGQADTNVGFHPPAETDAPATRSMLFIILFLLLVGTVIAVLSYNHYNQEEVPLAPTEEVIPPRVP